jgi:hypothetical protein
VCGITVLVTNSALELGLIKQPCQFFSNVSCAEMLAGSDG